MSPPLLQNCLRGAAAAPRSFTGYWIWRVNNLNEAIDWVKRCPNPMPGPSVIEIRQLYEEEDFDQSK